MNSSTWSRVRLIGGFSILAVLVVGVGSEPFVHGFQTVDGRALLAAAVLALATTVCCAWRWSVITNGMGVGLPMREAVTSYYRSQFLNSTLPGGVIGDVHRAVRHGRDVGDLPRGARAVVWDRVSGQLIQIVLTIAVLLVLPSPVRSLVPMFAVLVAAGLLVVAFVARSVSLDGITRRSRAVATLVSDVRTSILARSTWPHVVAASALAVVGHVLTFLVAARTVGSTASIRELVPLALLVLVAMGIPASVAGWGPREGMAAWAFGAAGLGAAQGVAIAVVYGVMVLVASLPGAFVLLIETVRRPVHV